MILRLSILLTFIQPLVLSEVLPLLGLPDRAGIKIWDDSGSWARYDLTIYEASRPTDKWFVVGQRAQNNYENLQSPVHSLLDNSPVSHLARPTGFTCIWDDRGTTALSDGSVWRAVCPSGFVALSDFFGNFNRRSEAPESLFDKVRCVRANLTETCAGWGVKLWDTEGMIGVEKSGSLWPVVAIEGTGLGGFFFFNSEDVNRPPSIRPECLKKSAIRFL